MSHLAWPRSVGHSLRRRTVRASNSPRVDPAECEDLLQPDRGGTRPVEQGALPPRWVSLRSPAST
eukprot:9487217-Pyramimonas_sp.AAC.1